MKPKSPMRFTTKAFLPAAAADGLVYQNEISRYEHRPTSSHPRNTMAKLPPRTRVSIEARNRFRYVKNRAKRSSPCMYPTEKTWIRLPTPVMISAITAASGSHVISRFAPMAGIHSHNITVVPWLPSSTMNGSAAMNATTNEDAAASVPTIPASGSPSLRPKKCRNAAPSSGSRMTSQMKSVMGGLVPRPG